MLIAVVFVQSFTTLITRIWYYNNKTYTILYRYIIALWYFILILMNFVDTII